MMEKLFVDIFRLSIQVFPLYMGIISLERVLFPLPGLRVSCLVWFWLFRAVGLRVLGPDALAHTLTYSWEKLPYSLAQKRATLVRRFYTIL